MFGFLESVGQWFAAHDLMSAQAGHWLAWVTLVAVPVLVIFWWAWMVEKACEDYRNEQSKDNRFLLFVAYTAPVSVPALFAMTAVVWTGRKMNMA